jgi:hypothetical protein
MMQIRIRMCTSFDGYLTAPDSSGATCSHNPSTRWHFAAA